MTLESDAQCPQCGSHKVKVMIRWVSHSDAELLQRCWICCAVLSGPCPIAA